MRDVPSPRVRGEYHRLLVGYLREKLAERAVKQEALAAATQMHQTSVGKIINQTGGGTFDLDEADAALRETGSDLRAFVNDPARRVAPRAQTLPPLLQQIVQTLRGVEDEDGLAAVLAAAKGVRAAARRKESARGRQRAVGRHGQARKTGGTR